MVCSMLLLCNTAVAVASTGCGVADFPFNLTSVTIAHGTLGSRNTTADKCWEMCCTTADCTTWQYHTSSRNRSHHPGMCWLSKEQHVATLPKESADTWTGGSMHESHPLPAPSPPPTPSPPPPPPPPPPLAGCNGTDYFACRRGLINSIFGNTNGALPTTAAPDYTSDLSETYEMSGLPGPGKGTGVGGVSWKIGLKKLVWTLGLPRGGMPAGMLRLNSTVWWSRNTTGDAPSNSPPSAVGVTPGAQIGDVTHCPDPSMPGYYSYRQQSDVLVIHHNGHSPCNGGKKRSSGCSDCTPNFDTAQDYLNQLGYDVMEMAMPLHGCNRLQCNTSCTEHCVTNPALGFDCSKCNPTTCTSHNWFQQFEDQGDHPIRYFLEAVVLVTNYALDVLKYTKVVMTGLSGGGWTTTIAAALDPRISLSMPIAGSIPQTPSLLWPHHIPDLPENQVGNGDYEQNEMRPMYQQCGWVCLYVLASLEHNRFSLQMLHEHDSCCFATAGVHNQVSEYNAVVQHELSKQEGGGGWFQTYANWGNFHQFNYRDKVVVALMIERLRRPGSAGGIQPQHFKDLPFDILQ